MTEKKHKIRRISLAALASLLCMVGCSPVVKIPVNSPESKMGEVTRLTSEIRELPLPKEKVVVGVYKFRDQTGQYKASETGASWSTAVPQGTTTILIKALEDSRWFKPIERENIGNLLNERQLIRTTRKEYVPNKTDDTGNLPPLLYAGIILEGGIISYDTNVMTGGLGARYFGIGGSTQYRQDRITVYIRAVSTLNGEVLKSVYTSKNILSTSINGSLFKFIDVERLMEAEVGITQNEPVQLAVTEAIEKAVYALIVEGIRDNVWDSNIVDKTQFTALIDKYNSEQKINDAKIYGDLVKEPVRGKWSAYGLAEATKIRGDYVRAQNHFGGKLGLKYRLAESIYLDGNASYHIFENTGILWRRGISGELNLEYLPFSRNKFSPYFSAGGGVTKYRDKMFLKAQAGAGLEFLITRNIAIRGGSQLDFGFDDEWDFLKQGTRNDQSLRFNLGVNFYLDELFKSSEK